MPSPHLESSQSLYFSAPRPESPPRLSRRWSKWSPLEAADMYRDLSPSTALRVIVASSEPNGTSSRDDAKLITSIEAASPSEKAFGIKVAESSKLLREWCRELDGWCWSGKFDVPSATRPSGSEDTGVDGNLKGMPSYWGSLPATQVLQYGRRLAEIEADMEELEMEGQKMQVLESHSHPKAATSAFNSAAHYNHLDELTALITVTILQALPYYSRLTSLTKIWLARMAVLKRVPDFLVKMEEMRENLDAAWIAIGSGGTQTTTSTSELKAISREMFERTRIGLEEKMALLGQTIDAMLDTLDGQEDTLPDHWIDTVEDLESDYSDWIVEAQKRVMLQEYRLGKIHIDSDGDGPVDSVLQSTEQEPGPVVEQGTEVISVTFGDTPVDAEQGSDHGETSAKASASFASDEGEVDERDLRSSATHEVKSYDLGANQGDRGELKPDIEPDSQLGTPSFRESFVSFASDIRTAPGPDEVFVAQRRSSSLGDTRVFPVEVVEAISDTDPASSELDEPTPDANSPQPLATSEDLHSNPNKTPQALTSAEQEKETPAITEKTVDIGKPSASETVYPTTPVQENRSKELGPSVSTDEQLERRIDRILTNIPAKINFQRRPPDYSLRQQAAAQSSSKDSDAPSIPLRITPDRSATPTLTLTPAYQKEGRQPRPHGDPAIRLYHLTQAGRANPIKLYIRLVGENGDRVMVRVGGGWADLGEYLQEYAAHHSRAIVPEPNQSLQAVDPRQPGNNRAFSLPGIAEPRKSSPTPTPPETPALKKKSSAISISRISRVPGKKLHIPFNRSKEKTLKKSTSEQNMASPEKKEFDRDVALAVPVTKPTTSGSDSPSASLGTKTIRARSGSGQALPLSDEKKKWIDEVVSKAKIWKSDKPFTVHEKDQSGSIGGGNPALEDMGTVGRTKRVYRVSDASQKGKWT